MVKAAPHDVADRPFLGTPRPLPRVLFCHVPTRWCGRYWTANTEAEYADHLKSRHVHQMLCEASKKDVIHG